MKYPKLDPNEQINIITAAVNGSCTVKYKPKDARIDADWKELGDNHQFDFTHNVYTFDG